MKKDPDERFWLFLVPSWVLSGFFFLIFLKNSGWLPKTPDTINDLAYLIVSFVFLVLPFISSMKLGKLLEFERKLKETREDMDYFKNDMRQMVATISAASSTSKVVINYGDISAEKLKELESKAEPKALGKVQELEPEDKPKTAIELKILYTLWNRQVLKFPELNKFFTFKLNSVSPEFLEFREAGNRLMSEGLIRKTKTDQFFLTKKGLRYCAEHYTEFPDDMWFKYIPLDQANLKKVLKKFRDN